MFFLVCFWLEITVVVTVFSICCGYFSSSLSDVNECSTKLANCSAHATCVNNAGSYACKCKGGFEGPGQTCTGRCYIVLLPRTLGHSGVLEYVFVGVFVETCSVMYSLSTVFCTLYLTSSNSLASSLHSIYAILLLITISVHDLILYSSAILDTLSTIKHERALCLMDLLLSHSDLLVWVWDTQHIIWRNIKTEQTAHLQEIMRLSLLS